MFLLALAATLLFLYQEHVIGGAIGFPLDDAWIHLQFAQNLAQGHGFSFNPGELIAGSTAPLWNLILVPCALLPFPASVFAAKAVGFVFLLLTGFLLRRIVLDLLNSEVLALLAALTVVLTGRMLRGALSGMEVSFAAFLITLGLFFHLRKAYWASTVALALGILARPDTVVLVPLVFLAQPFNLRRLIGQVLLVALIVSPSVAFSLATTGTPFPSSAGARVSGGLVGAFLEHRAASLLGLFLGPVKYLSQWARILWEDHPFLPLLTLVGLGGLWLKKGRTWGLPALGVVVFPVAFGMLAPTVQGLDFQSGRYASHMLPWVILVAIAGLAALFPVLNRWTRAVVVGAFLVILGVQVWPASVSYGWAVENINEIQVAAGKWLAANTPQGATVAITDAGAITFFSDRRIIDLVGLMTPDILPYRQEGEAGLLRYIQRACPDYMAIFLGDYPGLEKRRDLFTLLQTFRLNPQHNVLGLEEMGIFVTTWNRWRPNATHCAR